MREIPHPPIPPEVRRTLADLTEDKPSTPTGRQLAASYLAAALTAYAGTLTAVATLGDLVVLAIVTATVPVIPCLTLAADRVRREP